MRKTTNSTLFRLIEAGFLSRQALLQPVQDFGLEPGDDAILLSFQSAREQTMTVLADVTGLSASALSQRVHRLMDKEYLARPNPEDPLIHAITLTELGLDVCTALSEHWMQLEDALMGELKPKERKKLHKALSRFVTLLNVQAQTD